MRKFVLVGTIVGLLISQASSAQSFFAMRRDRSLIFVGGTGTATYMGELSNDGDYLQAKPNVNVGLQMYISHRVAVRADVTWYQLSGSDAKANDESRKSRNLSFYSNNFEISAVGIYDLYRHGRSFYQRPQLNFYAFAGIGLTYFNPKADYKGTSYSLADYKTELVSYSRVTPVIPMGLGVRFRLGPFTNLSFEGGFRKTFTDYLDDVSTTHHASSDFADPLAYALSDRRPEVGKAPAAAGVQRGNPSAMDAYMLYNVKLEYYLPVNFLQQDRSRKVFKSKRKAFYRYNKRGGLRK